MKLLKTLQHHRPDVVPSQNFGHHVHAVITCGFSDANGVPRHKDKFFVMLPGVDRDTNNGQRRSFHPAFAEWNGLPNRPLGVDTVRVVLRAYNVDDTYATGCRCQSIKGIAPAPGGAPLCATDLTATGAPTAKRWNGQSFQQISCLGASCDIPQESRKMWFTLVGEVEPPEDDAPPQMMVSMTTGSPRSASEFASALGAVESQWADMCRQAKVEVPFSAYGIPLEISLVTRKGQFTNGGRQYPRWRVAIPPDWSIDAHFSLVVSLHEKFHSRALALAAGALPAQRLISEGIHESDARDVLFPASETFDADTGEATQPITPSTPQQPATPPPAPVIPPATPAQPAKKPWYIQAGEDLEVRLPRGADVSTIIQFLEKQHSDPRKAPYAVQAIIPHADKLLAAGYSDTLIRMGIIPPTQQSAAVDVEIEDSNGFPPAPAKEAPAEGSPEWFAMQAPDVQLRTLIDLLAVFTTPDDVAEYQRSFVPLERLALDAVKRRKVYVDALGAATGRMGISQK